jgi:arylsulfatase A-like enzyme
MASQPNVVVILTDDQGWGDLSVNGNIKSRAIRRNILD